MNYDVCVIFRLLAACLCVSLIKLRFSLFLSLQLQSPMHREEQDERFPSSQMLNDWSVSWSRNILTGLFELVVTNLTIHNIGICISFYPVVYSRKTSYPRRLPSRPHVTCCSSLLAPLPLLFFTIFEKNNGRKKNTDINYFPFILTAVYQRRIFLS